jgi:hypothetical protein
MWCQGPPVPAHLEYVPPTVWCCMCRWARVCSWCSRCCALCAGLCSTSYFFVRSKQSIQRVNRRTQSFVSEVYCTRCSACPWTCSALCPAQADARVPLQGMAIPPVLACLGTFQGLLQRGALYMHWVDCTLRPDTVCGTNPRFCTSSSSSSSLSPSSHGIGIHALG